MTYRNLLLAVAAIAILIAPMNADTFTFYANGTSSADGRVQSGSAQFVIGSGTMTITLANLVPTRGVSQTVTGVEWTYGSVAPTSLLTGTAPWVVPTGVIDCPKNLSCVSVSGTSPYGWVLNSTNGWANSSPNLFAGDGSGHPWGIVNSDIDGSSDGLSSGPHNDYLVGPVSFTLSYTGDVAPTIAGATVFFGTAGESQPTTVPDGGVTLMMLGGVLVGLESLRRKFLA